MPQVPVRIETDRLVLRDFVVDDWPSVLAYQRDPRYHRFYPESWINRTDDQVRAFVQRAVDRQIEQPRRVFQLAITLPENGEVIGSCRVSRGLENQSVAETGYELHPDYWGRGLATEAARAIAGYGFREVGVHRIEAYVIADNAASVGVMRKVGFRLEGRLRENEFFQGRWWDTLVFGLLDTEWREGAASVAVK